MNNTIGIIISFSDGLLSNLKKFVKPKGQENFVFIVLEQSDFMSLEQSADKQIVLNSDTFHKKIKYYLCGTYDRNKNALIIRDCNEKYVNLFFETLNKYFEESLSIITPYDKTFLDQGFSSIVTCDLNDEKVCLTKKNIFLSEEDRKSAKLQVAYLKGSHQKPNCSIIVRLGEETVRYLEYLSRSGGTTPDEDGQGMTQKEVFGKFKIVKSEFVNGNIIHTLKLDKSTIIFGKDDEITTTGSLYNFHSHPLNAYLKYKTKYGVPSLADFVAVYTLCTTQNTIVHFISSLEGLYVISVNPKSDTCKLTIKDGIEFVKMHFEYPKDDILDLNDYLKFVNRKDIFKVRLIPWEIVHNSDIEIEFKKVGKTCIIRDEENL